MGIRKTFFVLWLLALVMASPVFCEDPIELPLTIAATGKLLIDIKVNGEPVTCILDTGSPSFLIMDEALVDKQKIPKEPVRSPLRFFAEDRGGTTYQVVFPQITIGPLEYHDVRGITLDDVRRATGTGYYDLPNFWAQGIVGMAFLEHFRVKIDYPRQKLVLYPAGDLPKPELFSDNAPVVRVEKSNKSLTFLLDTGSSFSIISEKALDQFGLHHPPNTGSLGSDNLFQGEERVDSMNIGHLEYRNMVFEVAAHFHEYAGTDSLWGIIGYDYLKDLVLDLDFPHRTIRLEKP